MTEPGDDDLRVKLGRPSAGVRAVTNMKPFVYHDYVELSGLRTHLVVIDIPPSSALAS